jgi:hypothetical protein
VSLACAVGNPIRQYASFITDLKDSFTSRDLNQGRHGGPEFHRESSFLRGLCAFVVQKNTSPELVFETSKGCSILMIRIIKRTRVRRKQSQIAVMQPGTKSI